MEITEENEGRAEVAVASELRDRLGPLNIADPIQNAAEEYLCAQIILDDMGIPREHDGRILSLVGRIKKATGTFAA